MQPENGQRFHLPELDGLRFIAFLLVFINNANPILKGTFLETFSAYCWFGVDLFFCLSAFLITKLLLTEYRKMGKINIRNFYIRRILRIGPLYFFYIALITIIIAPNGNLNTSLPGYLASLATFTFNFVYPVLHSAPIALFIPLWSISQEEQFYAAIPWLLQRAGNVHDKTKWSVLIILFAAGSVIRAVFIHLNYPGQWIYFLPFTHLDSMLGGAAIGLGLFDKISSKHSAKILFAGLSCILLIFLLPNIDIAGWGLMFTYPFTGYGMSSIVYYVTRGIHPLIRKILANKVLVHLGRISYGLYIFHFGAFSLTTFLFSKWLGLPQLNYPKFTPWVLLIAFSASVLAAFVSYKMLENPFLKLKERFGIVPSRPI